MKTMTVQSPDRFTATGRPWPGYKEPSTWEKCCPWGLQAPPHPPFRFTDKSIIPVIISVEEIDYDKDFQLQEETSISIRRRILYWWRRTHASHPGCVCVFMPRGEYLKYFARDQYGNYIGTEMKRRWSKDELDAKFGKYQHSRQRSWVSCRENGRVFMVEESNTGSEGGSRCNSVSDVC
ncbi:hypothetical protein F5884DRAFT_104780 [Xylogone sp. PMI_703]|nr:hypothetical protein F5884DRAFT_104780 [Xylogone sp. PMI_703]